jgi:hypothetical protein
MERDQNNLDKLVRNRRKVPRHPVNEPASLVLVHHGAAVACRLIDLSLDGCQVRAERQFLAGPRVRIEIIFKVLGEAFRVAGVTEWTRQKRRIGIRFLDVSERKRAALMQLINDIEELRKQTHSALPNTVGPAPTT